MNDTASGKGSLPDMEAAVAKGRQFLEQIEGDFDKLAVLCNTGFKLGMMDKSERDELANIAMSLKHQTLAYHSRMTKIAQRAGADGVIATGGPGR